VGGKPAKVRGDSASPGGVAVYIQSARFYMERIAAAHFFTALSRFKVSAVVIRCRASQRNSASAL
jgi:hypothetical protein